MRSRFILTPFFLARPEPGLERLAGADWTINRPPHASGDQLQVMAAVHEGLAHLVAESARRGARAVNVGGDCCATIGMLAGLQRAGVDPVIVWLDAHGDFNTPETTISGFIGGMPLAMLVGRGDQSLMRAAGVRPLAEADVILADARDLDPAERALLHGSAVRRVATLADVPPLLPEGRPVYVHFDVDVLDPAEAPAMMFPVPGGARPEEVEELGRRLEATGRVAAVSLTTWDLGADADGRTARACLAGLAALTGSGR